jgi:hypothetical protein
MVQTLQMYPRNCASVHICVVQQRTVMLTVHLVTVWVVQGEQDSVVS